MNPARRSLQKARRKICMGIIISIGFFPYFADRANSAAGPLNLLPPTIDLDGPGGDFFFCQSPDGRRYWSHGSRLGWLFMFMGTWLFVYRLILREEDGLLQSQGESHQAYLKAVPRFWPALALRVPSGGGQPRWGQAIGGESTFWLFGVAVLCFALTLNIKRTWIVFGAGFAVCFIVVPLIGKRAAASGTKP